MKITIISAVTVALAASLAAIPASSQTGHGGHGAVQPPAQSPHAGHGATAIPTDVAGKAFAEANAKMHRDMAIPFSGNADGDFARGMIPHHEGAVDMAKVLLQFGKDPELRKLAEDVIRTQNEEIAMMRGWLKKNGG